MDMGMEEDHLLGRRRYFPNFDEPVEEVIYPKGILMLCPLVREMLIYYSQTLMYLKNQIQPEERNRFHFFNGFFFRKLADMDKDPNSASDGRAAFLRVRKWTRKVDIFEKDFIFEVLPLVLVNNLFSTLKWNLDKKKLLVKLLLAAKQLWVSCGVGRELAQLNVLLIIRITI